MPFFLSMMEETEDLVECRQIVRYRQKSFFFASKAWLGNSSILNFSEEVGRFRKNL